MRIDTTLVQRLIASQFPQWADLPVRPVTHDGWDNRSFRLGERLVVRMPSAACYAGQVAVEQRWLPWLAPQLPLAIPSPVAHGAPGEGYAWPWSVYAWLDGVSAEVGHIEEPITFARDLGDVLVALARADATGGPPPGARNFWRGGSLAVYDGEVRDALSALHGRLDTAAAGGLWSDARATAWTAPPVWLHGDLSPGNLLIAEGRLCAVIDFGCCAVGDPACDLAIAWTTFDAEERAAFRARRGLDAGTWARGRGWALWKALIILAGRSSTDAMRAAAAGETLRKIRTDAEASG